VIAPVPAFRLPPITGLRTLVAGAGEAGRALARDLSRVPEFGLVPVGFLDDDPAKGGSVLGGLEDTRAVALAHAIDVVVVAIPGLSPGKFRAVTDGASAVGASVRYLPSFIAALNRDVVGSDMRALDLYRLIGRCEMHVVSPEVRPTIEGKRVLVTGAGGSIGSELCRQVRGFEPSRLFMLDHDESNLHRLQLELCGDALRDDDVVVSDIRDRARIDQVFHDLKPDVVFHAAAHKHLPLLEQNPCEGVKSNVIGTENVVRAARAARTGRFVLISTDKAADPISVLGATKRLAERIVQANATGPTVFSAVRFGNVLGSRGSLLSVLSEQLHSGAPVTITHPDVARFFMTIEEAVGLVLEAARMARGGEVFVLDMGDPVRIVDLVRKFAAQINMPDVPVRFTGLRSGEKLSEALFSAHEHCVRTAHDRISLASSTAAGTVRGPRGMRRQLSPLRAAATRNDAVGVRRGLARLVPTFPVTAVPARLPPPAAPYPDDF
jgi:FlaA1/EpsC-like NDP-sugar epimerase